MDLIKSLNEAADTSNDVDKLVAQYKEMIQAGELESKDVADRAGDDLEMLEYSPEDIERLVPDIVSKVTGD